MRLSRCHLGIIIFATLSQSARAADKNGVSPQAISLPSGPGSIQGLGESFQPQLNTGGASYAISLALPNGTASHTPTLQLLYDSGASNGPFGLGWMLGGVVSVTRNTDEGVPRYVDGPNGADDDGDGVNDNPEETDIFSGMDREELVPLPDGSFRAESETSFTRYERSGSGWLARRRDGTQFELGMNATSRIEDSGRVFSWLIDRITDTDGNTISYEYFSDAGSPGQRYLRTIRWGQPNAFFVAVFTYAAGRQDVQIDFRSGFESRTALRVSRIDVVSQGIPARADALMGDFDSNGVTDFLVRRWTLEYEAGEGVSLLSRVTQLGCDGVTALPPATLEYTQWTPPTNAAAHVILSTGEPAETLSSESVELCDMNGDGLPDLLTTSANQHRVAINLGMSQDGKLAWAPPVPVGNAPTIDIASSTAHLADSTADGLSDFVVKVSNTRFLCFDNTSHNSWMPAPEPLRNTDTWPIWPFDGANGTSSRSIDTDHNRRNDILFTSNAGYGLWLLLPQGQYARETRIQPLQCDGQTFRFDLPGTHIADLNGDRLQDLVWVQPTRIAWFPNEGRDRFGACQILTLGMTLTAADIEKTGFSDIDGDGLEDLTLVRPASANRSILYWLNRFQSGLDGPRKLDGLPALLAGDALRWADMNGNGSCDIVISNSARPAGSRIQIVELLPQGKPHVLSRAANGLGLVMTLEHETSVDQMVRARLNGTPWTSVMQITVPVVRRLIEDDGRGNVNTREITYRDPFWNAAKQEFRGFKNVQLREVGDDSVSDRITRHRFDAGVETDCMKGKELLDEVLDETGKVFSRNEMTWTPRVLTVGTDLREVCHAFVSVTQTLHIEGIEAAVETRTEKDYDTFGNCTVDRSLGITSVPGDEVVILSEYLTRPDVWIIDRVSRRTTFDGNGKRLAEQRFSYDTRGRIVQQEAWLSTEDRFIVQARNTYDSFGNLIETLDAKGRRRTMDFDPLLHAYVIAERYHLEDKTLETTADYDLRFGVITRGTEFNGATHTYDYDALGRITRFHHPDGVRRDIEYQLSNPVSFIAERLLEDPSGDTLDSFTYYDAYGRKLGTKVEAEGGKWRYLDAVRFNNRKLVRTAWLPYETATPTYEDPSDSESHESRFQDALGRPVRTIHADGTFVQNVYEPLVVRFFDENDNAGQGKPRMIRRDGLGRAVEVIEQSGSELFHTAYRWNALGDLVEVEDAQNNKKSIVYDSLRRKASMSDPDRGAMTYSYDDVGNLVRTVDARGQVAERTYDFGNRLLTETFTGATPATSSHVEYVYDMAAPDIDFGDGTRGTAAFTMGHLASVIDGSGETHLSYDARGNTVWNVKRIREPQSGLTVSYRTQFAFDLLERMVEVIYPDNDRAVYEYNEGNFVERVTGGPQGAVLVANLDHHPSGEIERVELGNGVVSLSSYDNRDRLESLVAQGPGGVSLMDSEYGYDPHSNLLRLVDRRPTSAVEATSPRRNTQVFEYDDLHRLVQARYASSSDPDSNLGQIDYDYDAIGNILLRTTPAVGQPGHLDGAGVGLGAISYSGGRTNRSGRRPADPPGPHAATGTASGKSLTYDANGNISKRDGADLTWDVKDQLVGFKKAGTTGKYVYDYSDRRTAKSISVGARTDETLYVNQYFEERPGGSPVKFVFAGQVRVARVEGTIDPSRDRVQRLRLASGWNALAIAVESTRTLAQVFGADAAFYTWRNGAYEVRSAGQPGIANEPLWVFVPTARVAIIKGRYAPASTPIAVPAGGAMVAWPRLEAFRPESHLNNAARIHVYDPYAKRYLLSDPSLPAFLQDLGKSLPASRSAWITAAAGTTLSPGARANEETLFYLQDQLGSCSVTTDKQGALVEELAYYPFGELRNRHSAGGSTPTEYDFTGKETDDESGLVYLGARFYDPSLGRFLSVDPLYADPSALESEKLDAFLFNPQRLGLYSYVLNNPLRFVDPDGLDSKTPRGVFRLTPEELKAVGFGPNTYVAKGGMPKESGWVRSTITSSNPMKNLSVNYGSQSGPVKQPDQMVNRSGWRRIPVELKITGPDGKGVADRYFYISFSGDGSGKGGLNGVSNYAVRTDQNGVIKFTANVPRQFGEMNIQGTYNEGGAVKALDNAANVAFERKGGNYDGIKFDAQVVSEPAAKGSDTETTLSIQQTQK